MKQLKSMFSVFFIMLGLVFSPIALAYSDDGMCPTCGKPIGGGDVICPECENKIPDAVLLSSRDSADSSQDQFKQWMSDLFGISSWWW